MKRDTLKKVFLIPLFFMIWLLPVIARAESPIQLSHTLTAYSKGEDFVTLSLSLNVKNSLDKKVYNLTLSYMPLFIKNTKAISLNAGTLKSQGSIDVTFTLTTPMLLSEQEFLKQPLFWAGKYTDSNDKPAEFPGVSQMRGKQ